MASGRPRTGGPGKIQGGIMAILIGVGALAAAIVGAGLAGRDEAPVAAPGSPKPSAAAYRWQPEARPDPSTPLPAFASADPDVANLYRFALARPDVLSYIPCTCGCGADGHRSNWNCYIRSVGPDGTVVFDDMAPG